MKAYHKNELANFAGVSLTTMRKYINAMLDDPAFEKYQKNDKILSPKQCEILCKYYGIIIESEKINKNVCESVKK